MANFIVLLLIITASLIYNLANALTFYLDHKNDIVGELQEVRIKKGETLFDIARRFDLGVLEIIEANPTLNPNKLQVGTVILLPTAFILPPGPREGLVLNLAELRIYFYPQDNDKIVVTHPVGIGRFGWITPMGEAEIIKKQEKPVWRPPESIRAHYKNKGIILPASIGPGPKNPLGEFAMYLSWPRYLIHGTNQPDSIGKRSSSGCIRMYPEDIKSLFNMVPVGTKIRIIHEPLKVGVKNGKIYLEAHDPFSERYYQDNDEDDLSLSEMIESKKSYDKDNKINWQNAKHEIKNTRGYPILINFSK